MFFSPMILNSVSVLEHYVLKESVTVKFTVIGSSAVTSPEVSWSDEINIVGEVLS